ncbi:hypothetical protein [Salipiger thiooxidans]|uniref:hypothetical protein n=1 Tax=Salipiger thiooxidans TaxID=282683 RepID=UPI001CD72389|nr:hypothetical protein [Salipiger thiooxidans]MCA0849898.1 hypothetical protein [Salipiger thiooxidans]
MLARAEAAVICPMLDGSGDLAATDHAMRVAARQGLRCGDAVDCCSASPTPSPDARHRTGPKTEDERPGGAP